MRNDDFWTWFTYRRFGFREVILIALLSRAVEALIGVIHV